MSAEIPNRSQEGASRIHIFTVNIDGSQLEDHTAYDVDLQRVFKFPHISADGRKLTWNEDDRYILIKDIPSGTVTNVLNDPYPTRPSLNANGSKLLYSRTNTPDFGPPFNIIGIPEIFVRDVTYSSSGVASVSAPTRLTTFTQACWNAKFNPAGTKIVFESNDTIWVMDSNGQNVTQMTTSLSRFPSFSPDGNTILFSGYAAGQNTLQLMTMPATGGTPTPMNIYGAESCFSSDATKFLFSGDFVDAPADGIYKMNSVPASSPYVAPRVTMANGGTWPSCGAWVAGPSQSRVAAPSSSSASKPSAPAS